MTWPLSQDYNEAIQSPRSNFSDPDLQGSEAVSNPAGIPMPCSGNFADVYQLRRPDGARWAVKCFTREVPGLRERYAAISRHLAQAHLRFIVDFTFREQGIRVLGRWHPIVKMQWVEGLTLNAFVRQYADKPPMLRSLLQLWVRMAARLREAGIAHADLQHGNVLLVPGIAANALVLKLVDYDGMFVPALSGSDSGEVGHPCYQHPQRLAERTYNRELDRFPLLLIATALHCVGVAGRTLWDKYDNGDNLLFREADLQSPVKSRLFYELLKLSDERASRLVRQTLDALKGPMDAVPLLEELLPEMHPPPAVKPAVRPAADAAATSSALPRRKSGRPRWLWGVAGGSMAALLGGIFLLSSGDATEKAKDEPRTVPNRPEQSPHESSEEKPSQEKPSDSPSPEKDVPIAPPPPPPKPRDKDGKAAPSESKPAEEPVKPNDAETLTELGRTLMDKKDWDGAINAFRRAIQLKEDYHAAHCNLSAAWLGKGNAAEAIVESRRAIELKEDCAVARFNLSIALDAKDDRQGAFAAYRQAIRLDPKLAGVRKNLGPTLQRLVDRLPGILKGEDPPVDPNDRLLLADICRYDKRLYGWAARLAAGAFKDKPSLAEDLKSGNRYNAVCCAALAGCGKGKDAGELHESARLHWLRQALDWLRADFDMLREQLGSTDAKTRSEARKVLRHWQNDPELACVRDDKVLAALPEAERPDWRKLWQEVARVLK